MLRYARAVLLCAAVALSLPACDADPAGPDAPAFTEPVEAPIVPPQPGDKPDLTPVPGSLESEVYRQREAFVSDLTGIGFQYSCDGDEESELIQLGGTLRLIESITIDPLGGFHYRWQSNTSGAYGIGEQTGEVFRAIENWSEGFNSSSMAATGAYQFTTRMVGTGSGRRFSIVATGKFTMNANGQLVVEHAETTVRCEL